MEAILGVVAAVEGTIQKGCLSRFSMRSLPPEVSSIGWDRKRSIIQGFPQRSMILQSPVQIYVRQPGRRAGSPDLNERCQQGGHRGGIGPVSALEFMQLLVLCNEVAGFFAVCG